MRSKGSNLLWKKPFSAIYQARLKNYSSASLILRFEV
jgi:hypothetical protein